MRLLLLALLGLGCSADHHAGRGKAALDAHDLAAAEKHFRAGLGREPNHVGALSGLGWVYLLAAQHEAADAAFGHCLSVSPKEVDCLRGSAGVATAKGNPAIAKRQLNKAVALAPYDARVQSSLALLELAAGEVDDAVARYRGLIDREPERAEYRLGIAEALIRSRDFAAALEQIEAGLSGDSGPKRTRAMLLQAQGRALVASASKHLDPDDCAGSAAAVQIWLDAAETAANAARATGVDLPDLVEVDRRVRRQRARVAEVCAK